MKRIVSLILAAIMLLSCAAVSSFAEEYKLGDLNVDGKCNISDVSMLLKYLAKWDLRGYIAEPTDIIADVNTDGKVNLSDATYYLKWLVSSGPKPLIVGEEWYQYWTDRKTLRDKGMPEPTFDEWLVENGYDVDLYNEYEKWIDECYYKSNMSWISYKDWLVKYGSN